MTILYSQTASYVNGKLHVHSNPHFTTMQLSLADCDHGSLQQCSATLYGLHHAQAQACKG